MLGLFAVAVVLGAAWVAVELRVPVPMIDMQMMRRRGVWTSNVVAGCVGFGDVRVVRLPAPAAADPARGRLRLRRLDHASRATCCCPSAVASFLVGFTTSSLIRRLGARAVITTGLLLTGAAFACVGLFHDHTWQLYAATTVQGVGSGLVFASLAGVVVAAVPPEQTGVASGMNANIRTIGGSIGAAVMAGIITAHLGVGGFPAERGYTIGFVVLGVVMALASLAALRIPATHELADLRPPGRRGGRRAGAGPGRGSRAAPGLTAA